MTRPGSPEAGRPVPTSAGDALAITRTQFRLVWP